MTQQGSEPTERPRLSHRRRVLLLAGGALLVGLAVVTVAPAVPRPVTVEIDVEGAPPEGLRVRSVIASGGDVVAEADEVARGPDRARLLTRYWLRPEPHVLEVRGRGCRVAMRRFTPAETDRVSLRYRCR